MNNENLWSCVAGCEKHFQVEKENLKRFYEGRDELRLEEIEKNMSDVEELKNRLESAHAYSGELERDIENKKMEINNQELELDEQCAQIGAITTTIKRLQATADNSTATANVWIRRTKEKIKENNTLKSRLEDLEKENKSFRACLKLTL